MPRHLFQGEVRAKLDSTRGSGQGRRLSAYGNYALHGKMYVFDGQRVLLGSWNYDQRSLRINTEIGLLIDSAAVSGEVVHRFDAMTDLTAAYEVTLASNATGAATLSWLTESDHRPQVLTVEPSRGWWPRVKARLLALLPLDHEL